MPTTQARPPADFAGESPSYDGRRGRRAVPRITAAQPPPRGRRAWALVLVLLVLVVLAIGIGIGRASVHAERAPSASSAPAPQGPGADASSGTPDRSERAAVRAATSAFRELTSRAYVTDPDQRAVILERIATADDLEQLRSTVSRKVLPAPAGDPVAAAFAPPQSSAWRLIPVGYRTAGCDDLACDVRIWSVQVSASTGNPAAPATASWGTTTLPMRWEPGQGWRLKVTAMTGSAGPTPGLPIGGQSSDLDLIAAAHDFQEYGDVSP